MRSRAVQFQLVAGPAALALLGVFVGSGSAASYWALATVVLGWTFLLARAGHWGAVVLIVAVATVAGTELRQELGPHPVTGAGLRLLDLTMLAALAGTALRDGWPKLALQPRALIAGLLPFWAAFAALAYVVALWFFEGHQRGPFFNTDARLLVLATGTFLVARVTVPGHGRAFAAGLIVVGMIVCAKAIGLHYSDLWTIGTFDRAQANQVPTVTKRTILVGGDTLLILMPGLISGLFPAVSSRALRVALLVVLAASFWALILSGTRSSLLVAAVLFAAAPFVVGFDGSVVRRRTFVVTGGVIAALLLVGIVGSGVGARFTEDDGPHQGLGFRRDEINTALHLPTRKLVLGQGIGGTFMSRDTTNAPVETAWSHVLPIWIVLKAGFVGLALLLLAGLIALWRILRGGRSVDQSLGIVAFTGILVMSLTIGRAALPEGVVLTACCFALLGWGVRSDRSWDA